MELISADLENPASLTGVGTACTGCYVHSTAGDTKQLDEGEVLLKEMQTLMPSASPALVRSW